VRFALRDEDGEDWYEFLIVCPGDMQMPTARRTALETRGLRFDQAVTADRLDLGQIVTLDGYFMSVGADPADPGCLRLVLVRALGVVDESPDQREIPLIDLSARYDVRNGRGAPHRANAAAALTRQRRRSRQWPAMRSRSPGASERTTIKVTPSGVPGRWELPASPRMTVPGPELRY